MSVIVKGMSRYDTVKGKRKRIIGNVPINGDGKNYNDDEIRAVWKACGEMGTFGALLKVALLTAQRRDKVMSMRWDDVCDGVWTIPYVPGEKTNARLLKLPPAVLDIINAQSRIAGNPYVFAGRGHGPIKSLAQGKKALDQKLPKDMPPWVIHDLRRTAKTLMRRAGVDSFISERVLGHTIPGVEGVYDQHDYSIDQCRQPGQGVGRRRGKGWSPRPPLR